MYGLRETTYTSRTRFLLKKKWFENQSRKRFHGTRHNLLSLNASPLQQKNFRFMTLNSGFVCHVDAAWNAVSMNCGMGWILTSNENSSAFTAKNSCGQVSSALVAETRALKAALIYVIDVGCSNITVRSDPQFDRCRHATRRY